MFDIAQRGSTIRREILGGATTFMAMSYIIFVQAGLLGGLGMDKDGVVMAVCLSAAAASIVMGLWANYPIALASGMGENFFFAFTVVPAMAACGLGVGWQMALALTVLSGVLFLLLSLVGFRSALLNAIPDSLKSGIAAGIGLFIAVIGFNYGNLVAKDPGGGLVTFPGLRGNPVAVLTLAGIAVTLTLMAFRVRGALLLGILASTGVALATGMINWCGSPVAWPHGLGQTAGAFAPGFVGVWKALCSAHALEVLIFTFILLFMVMFDTVGTLIGVAERARLIENGRLPRAEKALAADATGTIIGGLLGTSTVTSYIESITGVQAGARTGLSAIVAGLLMAAATFFSPLAQMIGGGIVIGWLDPGKTVPILKYPLIAPALIIVGAMMMRTLREVNWEDVTEYLPAFLTVVTMPLHFSIAAGIAIGFVSYAFGKTVTGRFRQCPVIVYVFAVLFVVQYVLQALFKIG
jgi:AGZA family xanthine/uracil permease-like MFS transporter